MDPTANVHPILCKYWKKCYGDPGNNERIVWRRKHACSNSILGSGQTEVGGTSEEQSQDIVHHFLWHQGDSSKEFVPAGQAVNSEY
jgi:hypothetical protein